MRDMRRALVVASVATAALALSLVGCGGSGASDASGDKATEQAAEGAAAESEAEAEPEETGVWVMTAQHGSYAYDYGDRGTSSNTYDTTYTLDEAGNVLSSAYENTYGRNGEEEGGSSSVGEYTYDEQGLALSYRMILGNDDKVEMYGEEGAALYEEREKEFPATKYEYELDDEGRPTKRISLVRQGDLGIVTSSSFDADGNMTVTEVYLDEDAEDPTYEEFSDYLAYTYDDAGNISSICNYQEIKNLMGSDYYDDNEGHTEIQTSITTYDEHGLATTTESTTEHDDGVKETTTTTYNWELDDDGKPLSLVRTSDDGSDSENKTVYTYDDNGNLASQVYDATHSSTNDEGETVSTKVHFEETYEWAYIEEPSMAVRLATHLFAMTSLFV